MYRVRKNWSDATTQKGAFISLANAKACADKYKLNVYDEFGKCLYSATGILYRVRKTWKDAASQIGAFKDLAKAKTLADKNAGYKVFNDDGVCVYAPKTNTNMVTFIKAVTDQASWMYKSEYKWESNPTVAKSKTHGTCVTFVACVLQRYGAIKPGQYIFQNGKGSGKGKVYGTITPDMEIIYVNNKPASEIKGQMKKGDIVMHDNTKAGHIQIYAGEFKNGKAHYWTGGCGSGHNTSLNSWDNRKIRAIVRLKSIQ